MFQAPVVLLQMRLVHFLGWFASDALNIASELTRSWQTRVNKAFVALLALGQLLAHQAESLLRRGAQSPRGGGVHKEGHSAPKKHHELQDASG